jgi:hypothetical protein
MARMPSTRSQPLNPHVAGASASTPFGWWPSGWPAPGAPAAVGAPVPLAASPVEPDPEDVRAAAARAGGFHESSYELRLGLDISESEWPDGTTVPGQLGER